MIHIYEFLLIKRSSSFDKAKNIMEDIKLRDLYLGHCAEVEICIVSEDVNEFQSTPHIVQDLLTEYPYNSFAYILYYKHGIALQTKIAENVIRLDEGLGDETIVNEEFDEIGFFETH